jgi:hypothetical protein
MEIQAEQLAYWYLRLNGFLTIPNFVVHPEHGRNQGTDVDILGVRFPYRAESHPDSMSDDTTFAGPAKPFGEKSFVALAEVKTGLCKLNGAWTDPDKRNMQRVLAALGIVPMSEVEAVAQSIYEKGCYSNQLYHVSMVCVGRDTNPDITRDYAQVPQISWDRVLRFIFGRFRDFYKQKVAHGQWDQQGRDLWDCSKKNRRDVEGFVRKVQIKG